MNSSTLFNGLPIKGSGDAIISEVSIDTRTLTPGDLFVALPGRDDDGHCYLKEAERAGASAVLVQADRTDLTANLNLPIFVTENTRDVLPQILINRYGDPSSDLKLIGVTGTNGKTTTIHLIESILEASGESTGLIGTIERRFAGESFRGDCTTPSMVEAFKRLRGWSNRGATAVVMEVTSHALDQGRVRGLSFTTAAFTNLSQDHLDYHGDMETYYQAKKKLFNRCETAVVYQDGSYGQRLVGEIDAVSVGETGDYSVSDPEVDLDGMSLKLTTPRGRTIDLRSPLTGLLNFRNIALAAAVALETGSDVNDVKRGIANCETIRGRCERLGDPPRVIIDYAHTPDAMKNVLQSLGPLVEGQLICVFGAGGDRDRSKRPKMGRIGVQNADYAVITSDNPRSEKATAIINDILEGTKDHVNYHVQADRGQAIREAIERSRRQDLVIVVGKGHETEQIIGDRAISFEDRAVAREVLKYRN